MLSGISLSRKLIFWFCQLDNWFNPHTEEADSLVHRRKSSVARGIPRMHTEYLLTGDQRIATLADRAAGCSKHAESVIVDELCLLGEPISAVGIGERCECQDMQPVWIGFIAPTRAASIDSGPKVRWCKWNRLNILGHCDHRLRLN